jgi:hypothetical protein
LKIEGSTPSRVGFFVGAAGEAAGGAAIVGVGSGVGSGGAASSSSAAGSGSSAAGGTAGAALDRAPGAFQVSRALSTHPLTPVVLLSISA